ncbi:MAG: L-aspartate oxidase [Bacteroidia bacterium]|nr:L-aspartate oxidase [Bacteroidia bacterium]MDW8157380.1 L-aspartate oxidase [Bacteroidia bacterium]
MDNENKQRLYTDFLVIGSGVAGLFFALQAASVGKVILITKAELEESNTWYAQGGIAGVFASDDSFEKHIQDTLIAGDGLCKEEIVRLVVTEGPACIRQLMELGAEFDRLSDGSLALGREGGHSTNRILHNKDATGMEIARTLIAAVKNHPNILIKTQLFAIDLITQHHLGVYVNRGHPNITCYGVYALDKTKNSIITILSKITVLASGGAGNVYASTTNPPIATGDGPAMVLRAKGRIANMEFYQFHPTALYEPGVSPAFLLTEALRGAGALLLSPYSHKRFMPKYDERAELAPRDIVARAIDSEMKISGYPYVYLDARNIDEQELMHHFPTIYNKCLQKGLDMKKDLIPIVPAAHYQCGGIEVDSHGRSSIQRLYAIGECSHTGLHGANRLASNSLLEALVFAKRAFLHSQSVFQNYSFLYEVPDWNDQNTVNTEEWILISHNFKEVQQIMSNYVGIVRTNARLERAERRISLIYQETEEFYQRTKVSQELGELRNIIACAYLIIKCAKIRKESRGLHYTLDYPQKNKIAYDTLL